MAAAALEAREDQVARLVRLEQSNSPTANTSPLGPPGDFRIEAARRPFFSSAFAPSRPYTTGAPHRYLRRPFPPCITPPKHRDRRPPSSRAFLEQWRREGWRFGRDLHPQHADPGRLRTQRGAIRFISATRRRPARANMGRPPMARLHRQPGRVVCDPAPAPAAGQHRGQHGRGAQPPAHRCCISPARSRTPYIDKGHVVHPRGGPTQTHDAQGRLQGRPFPALRQASRNVLGTLQARRCRSRWTAPTGPVRRGRFPIDIQSATHERCPAGPCPPLPIEAGAVALEGLASMQLAAKPGQGPSRRCCWVGGGARNAGAANQAFARKLGFGVVTTTPGGRGIVPRGRWQGRWAPTTSRSPFEELYQTCDRHARGGLAPAAATKTLKYELKLPRPPPVPHRRRRWPPEGPLLRPPTPFVCGDSALALEGLGQTALEAIRYKAAPKLPERPARGPTTRPVGPRLRDGPRPVCRTSCANCRGRGGARKLQLGA